MLKSRGMTLAAECQKLMALSSNKSLSLRRDRRYNAFSSHCITHRAKSLGWLWTGCRGGSPKLNSERFVQCAHCTCRGLRSPRRELPTVRPVPPSGLRSRAPISQRPFIPDHPQSPCKNAKCRHRTESAVTAVECGSGQWIDAPRGCSTPTDSSSVCLQSTAPADYR